MYFWVIVVRLKLKSDNGMGNRAAEFGIISFHVIVQPENSDAIKLLPYLK